MSRPPSLSRREIDADSTNIVCSRLAQPDTGSVTASRERLGVVAQIDVRRPTDRTAFGRLVAGQRRCADEDRDGGQDRDQGEVRRTDGPGQ